MEKAIGYLGDASSAQQLLSTLNSTLLTDDPVIANAIQNRNFEVLQKILVPAPGLENKRLVDLSYALYRASSFPRIVSADHPYTFFYNLRVY